MLPSSAQIFHGRESELREVVDILKQSNARVTILGTGGMGKTSLAIAALHHPEVTEIYAHRYFVACHSAASRSDLARSIAEHIGCDKGSLPKQIVNYLTRGPPSLLLLDNFETPWEPSASRSEVEDFLSLLSEVPHLAILVVILALHIQGF
jgi:AAA+ ATPase superfamily predicted ATPase